MKGGAWPLALALLLAAPSANAQHLTLPIVNLGQTSFLDGIGGPGLLVGEGLLLTEASRIAAADGARVPGNNHLASFSGTTAIGYVAPWKVLGGYLGMRVALVAAYATLTIGGATTEKVGIGDTFFAPVVYQLPTISLGKAKLFHRFVFDLILPTGSYTPTDTLNFSSHVFALNPFYSFTLLAGPFEVSARLYYLWCGNNESPAPALKVATVQPGQAVHANVALSYEAVKNFRLGVAGYALREITDQSIGGVATQNSREQVVAVGPGFAWVHGAFGLVANAFWEVAVQNRFAGARGALGLGYVWR